jgi:hypothetical protein
MTYQYQKICCRTSNDPSLKEKEGKFLFQFNLILENYSSSKILLRKRSRTPEPKVGREVDQVPLKQTFTTGSPNPL